MCTMVTLGKPQQQLFKGSDSYFRQVNVTNKETEVHEFITTFAAGFDCQWVDIISAFGILKV